LGEFCAAYISFESRSVGVWVKAQPEKLGKTSRIRFERNGDVEFVRAVLDHCANVSTGKLTRQHVFDIGASDPAKGVIAAIVWGFPKGGLPGGQYKDFASVFCHAQKFADEIGRLGLDDNISPFEALSRLNSLQAGIGFATTSKLAYFARLKFHKMHALIYDANVIKAIKDDVLSGEFPNTRKLLGSGKAFYHLGMPSYARFIEEANALATRTGVDPDQIEAKLFIAKANPGSGWN
jgi:hypothetical protein